MGLDQRLLVVFKILGRGKQELAIVKEHTPSHIAMKAQLPANIVRIRVVVVQPDALNKCDKNYFLMAVPRTATHASFFLSSAQINTEKVLSSN